MTNTVTSADGTLIAYDIRGEGPPVVLVAAAGQFRAFDPTTVALAADLAARGFTVLNYDRRGRGKSTDTLPFATAREVEDIAALLDRLGRPAALFGNSSGGALCLWAAQAGLPVTSVALWEVPLDLEGEGDHGAGLIGLQQRIAQGDRAGAVEFFMREMPPEWLAGLRGSPAWPVMIDIAPTLVYDAAVLEKAQHAPWAQQWAGITVPVRVFTGDHTLPIFPPVAAALASTLPNASSRTIAAANHGFDPAVMGEALAEFLRD